MAYDINWFKDNMKPVFANGLGNCSACCLRNLDEELFCKKLTCVDESSCSFVFWIPKNTGIHRELLMGLPSKDMVKWFRKTPVERTREISGNIINKALQNQEQHVK